MPVGPMPVGGTIFASDGSTGYPDVSVTCRNITRNTSKSSISDSVDGSYAFDLSEPDFGGYGDGDSCDVTARLGPFYKREAFTINTEGEPPTVNITLEKEDKMEILHLLRLNEEMIMFFVKNLKDPKNRCSIRNETQTGNGSKVKFTLAEPNVIAMSLVFVNNVIQTEWSDYYVDLKDDDPSEYPAVYFLSPPASGAVIDFTYKYGTKWIYPDAPRVDLTLSSYPRVRVDLYPINTAEASLGGGSNNSPLSGSVTVWSKSSNEIMNILSEVRILLMENKKDFHHFTFVGLGPTSRMGVTYNKGNRIMNQSVGFSIPLRFEKIEN